LTYYFKLCIALARSAANWLRYFERYAGVYQSKKVDAAQPHVGS
jgi:hypothetical protein